jgi:hypothetical protein
VLVGPVTTVGQIFVRFSQVFVTIEAGQARAGELAPWRCRSAAPHHFRHAVVAVEAVPLQCRLPNPRLSRKVY